MKLADLIKPVPSATSAALEGGEAAPLASSQAGSPSRPARVLAKPGKKSQAIRERAELIPLFASLLPQDPDLKWLLPDDSQPSEPLKLLTLDVEGQHQTFAPVYELKPSQAALARILRKAKSTPPLLLTTELGGHLLQMCRGMRLSAMDLNGRALLRGPGLLVDRGALPGRSYKHELEPRNIFVGKSARIVRTLLTDSTRDWNQRDLSRRTGASAGLISRIVQHLTKSGWLRKSGQYDFQLTDVPALLHAWSESDDLWSRTQTMRLAISETSPLEVAHSLRAWAKSGRVDIAFTQELALSLRHPPALPAEVEPRIAAAYVSRLPEPATLEAMDLRPLALGGDESSLGELWLHVPDDEGVFLESQPSFRFVPILQQKLNLDLPLVSDAQLYLDLRKGTGVSASRAEALCSWDKFCTRDSPS